MRALRFTCAALWLGFSLLACGASTRNPSPGDPPTPPDANGGAAGSDSGHAGSDNGHAGAGTLPTDCPLPPQTLTRLTFAEALESARTLFGDALAEELAKDFEEAPSEVFPPLIAPNEGMVITELVLKTSDRLAQTAGRYVRKHFELTGCAANDYPCVKDYVSDLAERAFRRPLDEEELLAVLRPVEQAEALRVNAGVGVEHGVYATLSSPHFLYRRAFGSPGPESGSGERALDSYELASSLSFFLTGGPPDAELLASANAGTLTREEELAPHVDRLLAAPNGRRHLEKLVAAFLSLSTVERTVIDPAIAPFSSELAVSMRTELDALLATELWSGGIGNLLTSRRSRIDAGLAALYGVPFPPAGKELSANGFVDVELPDTRAGLLTRAGWATMTSRPDGPSVVGRGLSVMRLLCELPPPFPDLASDVQNPPSQELLTEAERAQYRMTTEPCDSCHQSIDPLGLALDDLDAVGRFRSVDAAGRAIDASATLPAFAGGMRVHGALELSLALPEGALATCMSQAFLGYAVGLLEKPPTACELATMAKERAASGDQSFTKVLRQVALSRSLRLRR
jgi:Protein of unknown function (DUF1592)/Protein of unknown function (DUF1588)/Protein of unknown function (DUF1595)